jgi:acylphosphatase
MEAMNRREFLASAAGAAVWEKSILSFGRTFVEQIAIALQPRRSRAHLFISGVVQGVSYRASTQEQANQRGVVGWVRNLQDGRVEAVLQGPKEKVDDLIRWCRRGPPAAKVEKVDVAWEKVADEFPRFDVRY